MTHLLRQRRKMNAEYPIYPLYYESDRYGFNFPDQQILNPGFPNQRSFPTNFPVEQRLNPGFPIQRIHPTKPTKIRFKVGWAECTHNVDCGADGPCVHGGTADAFCAGRRE